MPSNESNVKRYYVVYREGDLHPIDYVGEGWLTAMKIASQRPDRVVQVWNEARCLNEYISHEDAKQIWIGSDVYKKYYKKK
jgi:hypothetical protein